MIARSIFNTRRSTDGRLWVRATIQSDTTPDPIPLTCDGIDGLPPGAYIDAGSSITVLDTSAEYVLGESRQWYAWVAPGSGGGGGYVPVPGPQGPAGPAPIFTFAPIPESDDNPGGYAMTVESGNEIQSISLANGRDGKDGGPGPAGKDGVSPTLMQEAIAGGHRVTMIDAEGAEEFDVLDGKNAAAMVERFPATDMLPGRAHITMTDAQGTTESDVYDGKDADLSDFEVAFKEITLGLVASDVHQQEIAVPALDGPMLGVTAAIHVQREDQASAASERALQTGFDTEIGITLFDSDDKGLPVPGTIRRATHRGNIFAYLDNEYIAANLAIMGHASTIDIYVEVRAANGAIYTNVSGHVYVYYLRKKAAQG